VKNCLFGEGAIIADPCPDSTDVALQPHHFDPGGDQGTIYLLLPYRSPGQQHPNGDQTDQRESRGGQGGISAAHGYSFAPAVLSNRKMWASQSTSGI
jgi:hypothetical protein